MERRNFAKVLKDAKVKELKDIIEKSESTKNN